MKVIYTFLNLVFTTNSISDENEITDFERENASQSHYQMKKRSGELSDNSDLTEYANEHALYNVNHRSYQQLETNPLPDLLQRNTYLKYLTFTGDLDEEDECRTYTLLQPCSETISSTTETSDEQQLEYSGFSNYRSTPYLNTDSSCADASSEPENNLYLCHQIVSNSFDGQLHQYCDLPWSSDQSASERYGSKLCIGEETKNKKYVGNNKDFSENPHKKPRKLESFCSTNCPAPETLFHNEISFQNTFHSSKQMSSQVCSSEKTTNPLILNLIIENSKDLFQADSYQTYPSPAPSNSPTTLASTSFNDDRNLLKDINMSEFVYNSIKLDVRKQLTIRKHKMKKAEQIFNSSVAVLQSIVTVVENLCSFKKLSVDMDSVFKGTICHQTFCNKLTHLKKIIQRPLEGIKSQNKHNHTIKVSRTQISGQTLLFPAHIYLKNLIGIVNVEDLLHELLYCLKTETNGEINGIVLYLFYYYPTDQGSNKEFEKFLIKLIILIRFVYIRSKEDSLIDLGALLQSNFLEYFCSFFKKPNSTAFLKTSSDWISSFNIYSQLFLTENSRIFTFFIHILFRPYFFKKNPFKYISDELVTSEDEIRKLIYLHLLKFLTNSISTLHDFHIFLSNEVFRSLHPPDVRIFDIEAD